jgi:hypothetical protein
MRGNTPKQGLSVVDTPPLTTWVAFVYSCGDGVSNSFIFKLIMHCCLCFVQHSPPHSNFTPFTPGGPGGMGADPGRPKACAIFFVCYCNLARAGTLSLSPLLPLSLHFLWWRPGGARSTRAASLSDLPPPWDHLPTPFLTLTLTLFPECLVSPWRLGPPGALTPWFPPRGAPHPGACPLSLPPVVALPRVPPTSVPGPRGSLPHWDH